jgi:exopolysaccharide production protein ExoZ
LTAAPLPAPPALPPVGGESALLPPVRGRGTAKRWRGRATPKLQTLQALRGLAALSVVVFHIFQRFGDGFWIGAAGVDVFFVVSGFVIWSVADREGGPGRFLWRRFTRIAPCYWLATLTAAAVAALAPAWAAEVMVTPRHLLLSLAFVPHIDPRGLPFPLLPPGWTLVYEAIFYAIVAAALAAPKAVRLQVVLFALVGLTLYGALSPPPAYALGANALMLEFGAGVLLAHVRPSIGALSPRAGALLAAVGVALLAALWIFHVRGELARPLLWGAPAFLIVAGALALERAVTPPATLVRLGDASYALYLCHFVAVGLLNPALATAPAWLFAPIALAVSLGVGLIFHRFCERPLIDWVRAAPRRLLHLSAQRLAPERP